MDGFHQCPLAEDSKKYTAFVTECGLYEYNVSPMGLKTSPNHFQYMVDSVLSGTARLAFQNNSTNVHLDKEDTVPTRAESMNLLGNFAAAYIDDIITWSNGSVKTHLDKLEVVVARLDAFGLKAKAPKTIMAAYELKFLGYMVGQEGKWADPQKVEAVRNAPIPSGRKWKSQLYAFLGLAGFYRSLIKDYAKMAAPLNSLLTYKGRRIADKWTEEHTLHFEQLKEALCSNPVVVHADFSRPFFIKTDSSKTHAGAILGQVVDGVERVIEYASVKLTKEQKKCHMTHLEAWAVVWALGKWSRFVDGRQNTRIITDHKALLFCKHNRLADANGKLSRWLFSLTESPQPLNIDMVRCMRTVTHSHECMNRTRTWYGM